MPRTKMQDEAEVVRWYEQGWTYARMAQEYLAKYRLRVSPSMFSEFRATRGLERRILRDTDLIPWAVKPAHRYDHLLTQLRVEARIREKKNVSIKQRRNWEAFRRELEATNTVVHYDPETKQGFFLVPREDGDTDLIRQPDRPTGRGRRD